MWNICPNWFAKDAIFENVSAIVGGGGGLGSKGLNFLYSVQVSKVFTITEKHLDGHSCSCSYSTWLFIIVVHVRFVFEENSGSFSGHVRDENRPTYVKSSFYMLRPAATSPTLCLPVYMPNHHDTDVLGKFKSKQHRNSSHVCSSDSLEMLPWLSIWSRMLDSHVNLMFIPFWEKYLCQRLMGSLASI